ncbi:MAG: L-histidine N(alpha)-methyltransferase [Acidimicrobiia bacterium]
MTTGTLHVDCHLTPQDLRAALSADARRGLTATPKDLPPKYFYDDHGSDLFDQITRLAEYYPTRTERSILLEQADAIVRASGATTLVELGSGTSEKTRILLDAFHRAGSLQAFVPFDVSEATLRDAARSVASEYPGVGVHAVVGDFEHHLAHVPTDGHRMVAFLGGTIGNFAPSARAGFLVALAATLRPGETLLLGTDLVKDPDRLVRAYDDAAGVTAAFNKNVLTVLNRELDADFDPADFDHVAIWNAADEWIEMRLRARRAVAVRVGALDLDVAFGAGEEMRTEISSKFRRERVADELTTAGFELVEWWTDQAGDFALSLARRT